MESTERPNHPFTLFNLGMTYSDAEEFEKAIGYLELSIAHSGESESHLRKAYALLVHAQRKTGQTRMAWSTCQEGLKRFPDDPELLFRSGMLLHEQKRLPEAVQAYLRVLEPRAQRFFSSIDAGLFGYKTRHNLAAVYLDQANFEDAEKQLRVILDDVPDYHLGWRSLGECLLRREKVIEVKTMVEQLLSRDDSPQLVAEGLLLRVQLAIREGDIPRALADLEQAIEALPEDLEPLDRRCKLLFEHSEPAAAERALRDFLERDPENGAAWHNLASVHCVLSHFGEAIECYKRSLEHRPHSADTLFQLGQACWQNGKRDEAIIAWERCLGEMPEHGGARDALDRAAVRM